MLDFDPPIAFYPGLDGLPLQSGALYFGVAGQNPVTNPATVYWDSAGTQPAAQPLQVMGGRTTRNGSPARVWLLGPCSRLVLDGVGRTVMYDQSLPAGLDAISFLQAGTGAVSRSAQDKQRESISILDFIPLTEYAAIKAGTSSYMCDAALANAMAVSGRYRIFFPAGQYKFAGTVNVKKPVILEGEEGAQVGGDRKTELVFPANTVGIFVHRANTNADSTGVPSIVTATTEGDKTIIRNLAISRTSATGTGPYAGKHGIWLKARATIENCGVYNFEGDGIHIEAYAASSDPLVFGNANNWQIRNCVSYLNKGSGLFVTGADANAGCCIGLDVSLNSKYGLDEECFLGNTYVAVHSAGNTLGSYKTANGANSSVFIGCYAESGQPAADLGGNSMCIGGLIGGAGFTAGSQGSTLSHTVNGTPFPGMFGSKSVGARDGVNVASAFYPSDQGTDPTLYFYHATYAPLTWKFMWKGGPDLIYGYGNSGQDVMRYTGPATAQQFGTGVAMPGYMLLTRTALCRYDTLDGRVIAYGAAAPTTGAHGQGEIVFNIAPAAGGKVGWVCTTAGTPGTWKAFGAIDP